MRMIVETDRDHFDWIFIAKGIGIFFVVIGHFHPDSSPIYWTQIRNMIYSFHMPLFFLLSGYLYNHNKYSYYSLIKAKTKRLLYPFASIALLFFLIKYAAGRIVKLDHPVSITSIYALLTDPVNSYVSLLWFVHALFLIFTVYPLVRLFMNDFLILLLFFAINSVFGNDYLVFGHALSNMPFFVVGVIFRENSEVSKKIICDSYRNIFVSFALFSLVYLLRISFNIQPDYYYLSRFLLGVIGSVFVINVSHAISTFSNTKTKDVLLEIGYYSMTIYLFHTLFESTVRIGFIQVLKDVQVPFELIAFLAVFSGVIFPLLLEKEVLRKFRITQKFILGIS